MTLFIHLLFFIAIHEVIFCSSVLSMVHCARVDEGMEAVVIKLTVVMLVAALVPPAAFKG